MKKAMLYGTVLVGLYLVVDHATGAGAVLKGTTSLATGTIDSLQGR